MHKYIRYNVTLETCDYFNSMGMDPNPYREMGSGVTSIASRALSFLSAARSILFQRHAALLVKNYMKCFLSGFISGV